MPHRFLATLSRRATLFAVFFLSANYALAQASAAGPQDSDRATQSQLDYLMQELDRGASSVASTDDAPAGIVPFTHGFNASMVLAGEHDSDAGWSQLTEPDIAYRFSSHLALSLSIPVYGTASVPGIPITTKKTSKGVTTTTTTDPMVRRHFLLGDLALEGSFDTEWKWASYTLTATMGSPTGDDRDGLGAGQFTYSVINHFEKDVTSWLTPEVELGVGDSSDLVDMRILKNYTATGTNAHFQAGLQFGLPWTITFTSDAYENLPLATQTVTSTSSNGKKGKQAATITTTTEKSIGEDNGFLNTLDIPLSRHVTLSGFYDRSLRNKSDTAGASLTFLLRGLPHDH